MSEEIVGDVTSKGHDEETSNREQEAQSRSYQLEQQTLLLTDSSSNTNSESTQSAQSRSTFSSPARHQIRKRIRKEKRRGVEEKADEMLFKHTEDTQTGYLLQWWKEIAAIAISIGFLVAVYGVLAKIHNTPLEHWSMPFDMQPTTLIATLITLSRLFLLAAVAEALGQLKWVYFGMHSHKLEDIEFFDSASRSALGSVAFLGKIRWRAVAASVGALVTILALAMEPFAQQSLTFYNKVVPDEGAIASIPLSKRYDMQTPYDGEAQSYDVGVSTDLSRLGWKYIGPLLGSMLEGLYDPQNTVRFSCPSTNCTWTTFETLGVCGTCDDVSTSLKLKCHYNQGTVSASHYYDSHARSKCNYTLPDGTSLEATCSGYAGGSVTTLWDSSVHRFSWPPNIVSVSSISFPAAADLRFYGPGCSSEENWRFPKPEAIECRLKLCAKTFNSSIFEGAFTEKLISSRDLIFPDVYCKQEVRKEAWGDPPLPIILPGFKSEDDIPESPCSKNSLQNESTFWVGGQDYLNMVAFLNELLARTDKTLFSHLIGEMLYNVNQANLTKDITGLAESMTNQIRMGPNTTSHNGTVWVTQSYIKVNWEWLVYPLALILLGFTFLVSTMIFSAQKPKAVWKSSSLAMLFHGLTGWDDRLQLQTTSDMKEAAKKIWVKLGEDNEGELNLIRDQAIL